MKSRTLPLRMCALAFSCVQRRICNQNAIKRKIEFPCCCQETQTTRSRPTSICSGLITLLGTVVTGALNIWLQWLQSRWQLRNEAQKDLHLKQVAALQKCVQMIDFIIASKNATLDEGGMEI